MVKIIGLGEHAVSSNVKDIIKTYALASCVAMVLYNQADKKLGMVHIVLPEKAENDTQHRGKGFFAATAVPLLFDRMYGGYPEDNSVCKVSLYGGSVSKNKDDVFNVGLRNLNKIDEILSSQGIRYTKSHTGGCYSRTIEAYVEDGRVVVRSQELKY